MTNTALSVIDQGLDTAENRNIEKILFGEEYQQAPIITSRICGESSFAHNITSNKAIENACNIAISIQTERLRELMLIAEIIQNHTSLLYSDILPSFIGTDNFSDLKKCHFNLSQDAVSLNSFANDILKTIGGRTVHPITSVPGGFVSLPTIRSLREIRDKCKNIQHVAGNTIRLFSGFEYPTVTRKTIYASLHQKGYTIYDGDVWTSSGRYFAPEKFRDHILEKRYSTIDAKTSLIEGHSVVVGPLSRLLINKNLPDETSKIIADLNISFTFQNPFENILAAAIENHLLVMKALEIISDLIQKGIGSEALSLPKVFGIGASACESASGTIFHYYEFGKDNTIIKSEIITPSNINLEAIKNDIETISNEEKDLDIEEKRKLTKLLLSSYGFCAECAKH